MPEQLAAERANRKREDWDVEHIEPVPQPHAEELSAEVEELLAEIDELLEVDAQAFVDGFKQSGGQ